MVWIGWYFIIGMKSTKTQKTAKIKLFIFLLLSRHEARDATCMGKILNGITYTLYPYFIFRFYLSIVSLMFIQGFNASTENPQNVW